MSEKKRTVILLCLLALGIIFLIVSNNELSSNFIEQL